MYHLIMIMIVAVCRLHYTFKGSTYYIRVVGILGITEQGNKGTTESGGIREVPVPADIQT